MTPVVRSDRWSSMPGGRPRAFCEIPAGLASVSLRLHGGPHCRPPISRMGNKAGYAEVILGALGLRSGQGAGAYVWCEADADVRGLLRAYPDAAMLRRVAEIIRGWADEEPRALWERLRAERKARGPRVDEEGTAGWMWVVGNTIGNGDSGGFAGRRIGTGDTRRAWEPAECSDRCLTLAEYATIAAGNPLVNMAGPEMMNTGNGGTRFGGEFATPARDVAAAFERVAGEVAGFAVCTTHSRGSLADAGGFNDAHVGPPGNQRPYDIRLTADYCERTASRWPPVAVLPTIPTAAELAALLGTPGDLEGVVVYMDPPYVGTTGYAHDLPRSDVVAAARRYALLGAVVAISEAAPVSMGPAWRTVRLTEHRKGQKRTFSRQKEEWLTVYPGRSA